MKKSLQLKAVESYMTLMKEIVSNSEVDEPETIKLLIYCVVIDDYVESMEDTLNTLAKKKSDTNAIEDVRKSLSRFHKNKDKEYYYDDIMVLSPYEFKGFMDQNVS